MNIKNQPIHFSIAVLMLKLLAAVFLVETGYVLLLVGCLVLRPPVSTEGVLLVLWALQTGKFIAVAVLLMKVIVDWAGEGAFVAENVLTLHKGVVKAEETVLELQQLRVVSVLQGWLGRRLNFGTLELGLGRMGSLQKYTLPYVHDPWKYKEMLATYIGGHTLREGDGEELGHGLAGS